MPSAATPPRTGSSSDGPSLIDSDSPSAKPMMPVAQRSWRSSGTSRSWAISSRAASLSGYDSLTDQRKVRSSTAIASSASASPSPLSSALVSTHDWSSAAPVNRSTMTTKSCERVLSYSSSSAAITAALSVPTTPVESYT